MKLSYQVVVPPQEKTNALSPVILLHGRMDSKKTWKSIAPEIAAKTGRKVFCLDARNHGDSPWSDEMNFEVLTKDLEDFIAEQGLKHVILVGHSMGGRTSMFFALKQPSVVEKLIIEDMVTTDYPSHAKMSVLHIMNLLRESLSAVPPDSDEQTAKNAILEFIKSRLPPAIGEGKQSTIFDPDTLPIKQVDNAFHWQANLDVLENMLHSEKNNRPISGLYNGEALFLYGTQSFFDVLSDENINKHFPKALKVPVEGAGHLIHQDYPEEFLKHVIKFINSTSVTSTL